MASAPHLRRRALAGVVLALLPVLVASAPSGSAQDDEDALIAQEREEADLLRRRGRYQDALALTDSSSKTTRRTRPP